MPAPRPLDSSWKLSSNSSPTIPLHQKGSEKGDPTPIWKLQGNEEDPLPAQRGLTPHPRMARAGVLPPLGPQFLFL